VQARQFAERLRKEAGSDSRKQIQRAFALALGRVPTDGELSQKSIWRADRAGSRNFVRRCLT
jgi:hypothetical protein